MGKALDGFCVFRFIFYVSPVTHKFFIPFSWLLLRVPPLWSHFVNSLFVDVVWYCFHFRLPGRIWPLRRCGWAYELVCVCVCSGINESVSTGAWEFRTSIPLCLSDGLMWVFFVVLVWFWWILFILKVMWFLNRKLMMWFLFRFHCHENKIWSTEVRFVVGISFVWANNKKEITSTSSNIYPTNIYPGLLFPRVPQLVRPTGNLINSLNTHVILIRYFSFYD